jgi:hypothetical protein
MCRAVKVLCVATDPAALTELRRAAVSADWELTPGATSVGDALNQLHELRPHIVVVFGPFEGFVERALDAYPSLRVIADREMPGVAAIVARLEEVREAILGGPRPGPVR